MAKRYTWAQHTARFQLALKLRRAGHTMTHIAEQLGCTAPNVRMVLMQAEFRERNSKGWAALNEDPAFPVRIFDEYMHGSDAAALGSRFGISSHHVRSIIRSEAQMMGLPIPKAIAGRPRRYRPAIVEDAGGARWVVGGPNPNWTKER